MDVPNGTQSDLQRLGDFDIIREIGRGGMGVVYEARQRSLNRQVALKVLSSGLGLTTKAIQRFKREAEAAAKLHHTNIVPIYFTGEEDRVPYYVMELIDGPSLDHVIRWMKEHADHGETGADPVPASSDDSNRIDPTIASTIQYMTSSGEPTANSSTPNSGNTIQPNHQLVQVFRARVGRLRAMELVDPIVAKRFIDQALEDCRATMGQLKETPLVFCEFALANLAAANIYENLPADPAQDYAARAAQFRDEASKIQHELLRMRHSPDAQYALVILFEHFGDAESVVELADEWNRDRIDVFPYAAQYLGVQLFKFGEYQMALDWLAKAGGRQGRHTRFLEFFVRLALSPGPASRSQLLREVRTYAERKIEEDERSFLSFDAMLLVLLGYSEGVKYFAMDELDAKIRGGTVYTSDNKYFCPPSERLILTPDELIAESSKSPAPVQTRMHSHFFLGVEALSKGRWKDAEVFFNNCVDDGGFHFYVYSLSRAILAHRSDWGKWVEIEPAADASQ